MTDTFNYVPSASGMIKNMNFSGLNLPGIIQELKDNCDDAKAKNIHIYSIPDVNNKDQRLSEFVILDDGCGMTSTKLRESVRIAFHHDHGTNDVGKFGMGMKTSTMALGSQITIVSKKDADTVSGIYQDTNYMITNDTFEPTSYSDDGSTYKSNFPPQIWKKFESQASGTMISVKGIKPTYARKCEDLPGVICRSMNLAYKDTAKNNCYIYSSALDETPVMLNSVDVFYRKNPEALEYCGETELRVFSNDSGYGHTVYEVLKGSRIRGVIRNTGKTDWIKGTVEAPKYYKFGTLSQGKWASAKGIHDPEKWLPKGDSETMKVRFIMVKEDAFKAEGESDTYKDLEHRRRGMWFYRGDRLVASCLTLEEKLDDHSNRMRMEVQFPPALDSELSVQTNKQMSSTLKSKDISDALRVLWKQQLGECVKMQKKQVETHGSESVSSDSSDSPVNTVVTKGKKAVAAPKEVPNTIHDVFNDVRDKANKPVVEQPVVEQPVVEQPVVEQPVVEQPVVEQPVVGQPVVEQPVVGQPIIQAQVITGPHNTLMYSGEGVIWSNTGVIKGFIPGYGSKSHLLLWLNSVPDNKRYEIFERLKDLFTA